MRELNAAERKAFERVLAALARDGLLLMSDALLPSATALIAGEGIRGSWWSHPKGKLIFNVLDVLSDHEDVASAKLISGKVTFVHRSLWPHLAAIGASREAWQMNKLPAEALRLLALVEESGSLRADRIDPRDGSDSKAITKAAKILEDRLLVYAEQFHTEKGAHAKQLSAWPEWCGAQKVSKMRIAVAKMEIEKKLDQSDWRGTSNATLPWVD